MAKRKRIYFHSEAFCHFMHSRASSPTSSLSDICYRGNVNIIKNELFLLYLSRLFVFLSFRTSKTKRNYKYKDEKSKIKHNTNEGCK